MRPIGIKMLISLKRDKAIIQQACKSKTFLMFLRNIPDSTTVEIFVSHEFFCNGLEMRDNLFFSVFLSS